MTITRSTAAVSPTAETCSGRDVHAKDVQEIDRRILGSFDVGQLARQLPGLRAHGGEI